MFKSVVLFLSVCALCAQSQDASRADSPAPPKQTTLQFDLSALDRTADPCSDFYQYACGNWMKNNPIPPDQSRWGRFNELEERNREILRDDSRKGLRRDAGPRRDRPEIGDFYAACMDEKAIDARGTGPIQPELDRIAALDDKKPPPRNARLHRSGVSALFEFRLRAGFQGLHAVIAQSDQGGLGLPDRDYYLKKDAKSVEIRARNISRTCRRCSSSPASAATRPRPTPQPSWRSKPPSPRARWTASRRRDPEKVYHKMTRAELAALGPDFRWTALLRRRRTRPRSPA